jgi:hypothetical protein
MLRVTFNNPSPGELFLVFYVGLVFTSATLSCCTRHFPFSWGNTFLRTPNKSRQVKLFLGVYNKNNGFYTRLRQFVNVCVNSVAESESVLLYVRAQ